MLRRDYRPIGAYGWPPPTIREVQARWLRWTCLIVAALGVLALVSFVISHDDPRQPGLSDRAWLTLGAAALLLVALGIHQRRGGGLALLRAAVEYATVALLAVLLTITALPIPPDPAQPAAGQVANQPAQQSAANPARLRSQPPATRPSANPPDPAAGRAGDGCPPVKRVHAWLACLWRQANPPEQGRVMPLSPAPPTRRTP
jgi:hypothetical protein